MAVTITQQPTSPNVAYTDLIYVVSGSGTTSNPQYQYVLDIYQSSTRISRLYSVPNPGGLGVFNISKIIQGELQYDNDWKTSGITVADDSFKQFDIAISESYGTSISSSTTVYAGGDSGSIEVFPGTIDPNGGSYNLQNTGSFQVLTNQVEGYISTLNNHITLPIYCPPFSIAGDIRLYVDVRYPNPLASCGGVFTSFLTGADYEIQQVAIGSGSNIFPGCLADDTWTTMKFWVSGSDYDNDPPLITYNRVPNCNNEGVTFAYINEYGYYDYYSIANPVVRSTNVLREDVVLPRVDYSNTLRGTFPFLPATSPYDLESRGKTQYFTDFSDSYEVVTDYINQATANYLEELLESPEVFIQRNGEFIPVIISNSNYTANTNENRQKLFQYTITFRPAKGRNLL